MVDALSRVRYVAALFACTLPLWLAQAASAQTIDLSLNVFYSTPTNMNSGGTWQLVAKSTDYGIAALDVRLSDISTAQNAGPQGTVNSTQPAGFSLFYNIPFPADPPLPAYHDVILGQEAITPPPPPGSEESVFYGVGTLTNGAPDYAGKPGGSNSIGPTFTSLTNVQNVPWATGDAFHDSVWDTAALLASGTFAAGVTPDFVAGSSGQIFTTLGTSTTLGDVVEATSLTTTVRTNLGGSADYNHNGIVDAADYVLWRKTFGQSVTAGSGADGNGNGMIDQPDYDLWRAHFGAAMGAGSGASLSVNAVPEPASCILLAIGAALAIASRRGYVRCRM